MDTPSNAVKPLTAEERKELAELCTRTTPGPWEWNGQDADHLHLYQRGGKHKNVATVLVSHGTFSNNSGADAEFITAARTALPAALAQIEADAKRIAELEARLAQAEKERDVTFRAKISNAFDSRISELLAKLADLERQLAEPRLALQPGQYGYVCFCGARIISRNGEVPLCPKCAQATPAPAPASNPI